MLGFPGAAKTDQQICTIGREQVNAGTGQIDPDRRPQLGHSVRRHQDTDPANARFNDDDTRMTHRLYYDDPAPQRLLRVEGCHLHIVGAQTEFEGTVGPARKRRALGRI